MIDGKRIASLEELNGLGYDTYMSFLEEAFNNGAEIYIKGKNKLEIVARTDELQGKNIIGIMMVMYNLDGEFSTWVALEDGYGIRDLWHSGEYKYDDGYKNILQKAIRRGSSCDGCHKEVGVEKLKRVAFSNKYCPDCYDEAKKHLEFPGWCD